MLGIIKESEKLGIKTQTGKNKWNKRTIDVMLSNEKYIGIVRLLDKGEHEVHYASESNYPPIIFKEKFESV
ncbi:MAG: recombinase family protein [Fastidiosipilaceae bacterium]